MDLAQRFTLKTVVTLLCGIAVSAFSAEPIAEFPIQEYDELLYLDVVAEGKERTFVLDSGCAAMMLDERVFGASNSDETVNVTDAHGTVKPMKTILSPPLRFGRGSYSAGQPAVVVNLNQMSLAVGRETSGVLGVPLLSGCVVQANARQGRLIFLDPETVAEPEWGEAVPVTYERGRLPRISLRLPNGEKESVVVDTGATRELSLRESVFRRLIASKHLSLQPTATSIAFGVHGAAPVRGGRLVACELAGFRLKDVPVSESSGGSHIGMGLLRRFVVTIDLGQQRIYFAANEGLNDDWPRNDHSVGVVQQRGRTTILYLVADSPASKSGLQFDDELRAINGDSISDWPLGRIRKVLREAESDLKLEVLRDGEAKEIVLPRG